MRGEGHFPYRPVHIPEAVLERGACVGRSDVDMTPSPEPYHTMDSGYLRAVEAARFLCATCPVEDECRDWGITHAYSVAGIVGGLTERERQNRKRGRG